MRVTGNESEREEQTEEGKRRDEAEGGRREKRYNDLDTIQLENRWGGEGRIRIQESGGRNAIWREEETHRTREGGTEQREGANGARKDDNERSEEDEREDREGEFGIASSNANLFYS